MEQGPEKGTLWETSELVIGALIEVHRHLGPGLLESVYESCVCRELALRGVTFQRQRPMPLIYKGMINSCSYRLDLVVRDCVLVELKAVESVLPIHVAQVVTYLRLSQIPVGLLVNFNVRFLRDGLRRIWLSSPSSPPPLPVLSPTTT